MYLINFVLLILYGDGDVVCGVVVVLFEFLR